MNIIETEYEGFRVDDQGNVYGKRGNILKGCIDRCGYREVCLSLKGKQKSVLVHRLILNGNFKVISQEEVELMKILRLEGKTQKEIAKTIGCSTKTVRKYLKRG